LITSDTRFCESWVMANIQPFGLLEITGKSRMIEMVVRATNADSTRSQNHVALKFSAVTVTEDPEADDT
jgi:hypothetical protein